jgi:hypothetical protein
MLQTTCVLEQEQQQQDIADKLTYLIKFRYSYNIIVRNYTKQLMYLLSIFFQ